VLAVFTPVTDVQTSRPSGVRWVLSQRVDSFSVRDQIDATYRELGSMTTDLFSQAEKIRFLELE